MKRLTGTLVGVISLGIGLAGLISPVYGHGGDTSLIHTCVKKTGGLRIIEPDGTCKKNETALDWSDLGSFDALAGLACTRNGQSGTVNVSYPAGDAVLRCVTATRFFDNGDGTVTDTQTGLQWEKKTGSFDGASPVLCSTLPDCPDPHHVNNAYYWSSSGTAADGPLYTNFLDRVNGKACETGDCQGLGSHTDWRIPTTAELRTILLAQFPCATFPCIDPSFGPTAASRHLSSTTDASSPADAWDVWFHNGSMTVANKSIFGYARAVRGGR